MLQHEPQTEEAVALPQSAPAQSFRVTPEELVQAAAAIEARREEERRQEAETLPLTEAIQHLGLHTTPEEMQAEVEQMRQQHTEARLSQTMTQTKSRSRLGTLLAMGFGGWLVFCLAIMPWAMMSSRRTARPFTAAASFMQKLTAIPDNTPVHLDGATLLKLADGDIRLDEVMVDARSASMNAAPPAGMFRNEWEITKSGNDVSVRAWARTDRALQAANGQFARVYATDPVWHAADSTIQVELPVRRFAGATLIGSTSRGFRTDVDDPESLSQCADLPYIADGGPITSWPRGSGVVMPRDYEGTVPNGADAAPVPRPDPFSPR